MKTEEKVNFLTALENNPRVSKLWYDKDLLKEGREDSVWFSGVVLSFLLDGRYGYECVVIGDVRITHIPTNDSVVSKGFDGNRVAEFLESHGYQNDNDVFNFEDKGADLYFENNNWFEDRLFDTENKEYLSDDLDISDGVFSNNSAESFLSFLDEVISNK